MNNEQQTLQQGWAAIAQGCQDALSWVDAVRPDSRRLDNEADNLNLNLLRTRNQASSLGRVSATPMTVGFFGLSQAGKSYLISALAAGHNGELEACYGSQRVDFIKQVNPPGGGKEATGLVTRFTSHTSVPSTPEGYPVPLRLFSEVDVAKILANAWFNDFNHEQLNDELDDERIAASLQPFLQRASQNSAYNGVSQEDVVSLWDYLNSSFKKSVAKLEHAWWPKVLTIAPALSPSERADLFALLWGDQPELTEVYRSLAGVLTRVQHADMVFAPLDMLLRDPNKPNIMNVDCLGKLGTGQDRMSEIRFKQADQQYGSATIALAELAALTSELIFPLAEAPAGSVMEQVDLLDFPGYRGRGNLLKLQDAATSDQSAVSSLLLRGKVAYLFEQYTDNQEMNALVVCASSTKQSDVSDVGPVLSRWVEKTQGKTAEERAHSKAGLFWAITMCDNFISANLQHTESQLQEGLGGLMKLTLLERFSQYDWLQAWSPNKPFDNCFLVRKPGLINPFLTLENVAGQEREVALTERYQEQLNTIGRLFAADSEVRKHVADPQNAWNGMLTLNDGGMSRLTDALRGVANLEFKLQRLHEQLQQCRNSLTGNQRLGRWYEHDGDNQAEKKQAIAHAIGTNLYNKLDKLGELLTLLDLPEGELRNIYQSIREQTQEAATDEASAQTDANNSPFGDDPFAGSPFGNSPFGNSPFNNSLFGDSPFADNTSSTQPAAVPKAKPVGRDDAFAQQAFKAWISHLRELPQQTTSWQKLGIHPALINPLCEELITVATRHDVESLLKHALAGQEQVNISHQKLAARQVLRAQMALRDFIAWFGYLSQPKEKIPQSYLFDKKKIFTNDQPLADDELPQIPEHPPEHLGQTYAGDWISALMMQIQDNAGHSATRDISVEANQKLGHIIRLIKQETL